MEIKIENGFQYKYEFSFFNDDIIGFAKVSGDNNPIHLDEEYASKTIFKRRIIHGFLGGSVFSKVFGTIIPGEGTIYLSQSLKFMGPMYIGEPYTAVFDFLEVDVAKHRAKVQTKIVDCNNNVVISGEALVLNHNKIV
ncbi:MAG: MaoC family dehydratase [Bacteroidetes bacterium]|nr:MaoC family dehydratase [Bacteroidota bacterium]